MGFARGGFTLLISGGCKQINKQLRRRKVREENHRFHTAMHTQRHTHTHTQNGDHAVECILWWLCLCVCLWAQRKMHFFTTVCFSTPFACVCVYDMFRQTNEPGWIIYFFTCAVCCAQFLQTRFCGQNFGSKMNCAIVLVVTRVITVRQLSKLKHAWLWQLTMSLKTRVSVKTSHNKNEITDASCRRQLNRCDSHFAYKHTQNTQKKREGKQK